MVDSFLKEPLRERYALREGETETVVVAEAPEGPWTKMLMRAPTASKRSRRAARSISPSHLVKERAPKSRRTRMPTADELDDLWGSDWKSPADANHAEAPAEDGGADAAESSESVRG